MPLCCNETILQCFKLFVDKDFYRPKPAIIEEIGKEEANKHDAIFINELAATIEDKNKLSPPPGDLISLVHGEPFPTPK